MEPDCTTVQETVCTPGGYSHSPPHSPHHSPHSRGHYGLGKREAEASRHEKSYSQAGYHGYGYGHHHPPLGFGPLARLPHALGGLDPWSTDNKGNFYDIVRKLNASSLKELLQQLPECVRYYAQDNYGYLLIHQLLWSKNELMNEEVIKKCLNESNFFN